MLQCTHTHIHKETKQNQSFGHFYNATKMRRPCFCFFCCFVECMYNSIFFCFVDIQIVVAIDVVQILFVRRHKTETNIFQFDYYRFSDKKKYEYEWGT